jgi:hypothetical protein
MSYLNPAHGLQCAGETGPHAAARRPAAHGRSRPNPAVLTARGAGAHRPRACWRLTCRVVEGKGTRVVGGVRRARWEMAWLTEEVGCRWGGGERPAQQRSDGGGRSDGGWRCSALPYGSKSGGRREAEPKWEKWGGGRAVMALTSKWGRRRWRGQILGAGRRSDGGGGQKSSGEGGFSRGVLRSEDGEGWSLAARSERESNRGAGKKSGR